MFSARAVVMAMGLEVAVSRRLVEMKHKGLHKDLMALGLNSGLHSSQPLWPVSM